MKVAIVGSRRRADKENVVQYVSSLQLDDIVVSGGCEGVDTWAIEAAEARGMKWKIFFPDMSGAKTYYEKVNRYYDRNEEVVKFSDIVVAFVAPDRKGGTENTVKWAGKYGKPAIIFNEDSTDAK